MLCITPLIVCSVHRVDTSHRYPLCALAPSATRDFNPEGPVKIPVSIRYRLEPMVDATLLRAVYLATPDEVQPSWGWAYEKG